ncbi:hypothetical protein [Streptomyces rochei]
MRRSLSETVVSSSKSNVSRPWSPLPLHHGLPAAASLRAPTGGTRVAEELRHLSSLAAAAIWASRPIMATALLDLVLVAGEAPHTSLAALLSTSSLR